MKTYIQKKIERLLKENTGAHFLDSGGAYGRHWERNQKKTFSFNDDIKLDDYGCYIPVHVYMNTMFEVNEMTKVFNKMLSNEYYWTGEAADKINELFEPDFTEDNNTYNFDNDLSQDFQYNIFEYDGDYYCIFQLHNGCDARGGYTSAQVFKVIDYDYFHIGMRCDFYDNETG